MVGAVYLYDLIDGIWTLQQTIEPTDLAYGGHFGHHLDLDGDVLVSGAPGGREGSPVETAYVYRRNTAGVWEEEQVIEVGDAARANDLFYGVAAAVDGDTLAVGSLRNSNLGGAGAVSIFEFDGSQWNLEQVVQQDSPTSSDYFGASLDLDAGQLVVGATLWSNGLGAAFVFGKEQGSWTQQARLGFGATARGIGLDVALDGDVLLASWLDNSSYKRFVTVFRSTGASWEEEKVLRPRTHRTADMFGYRVDVDGGTYLVGAYCDRDKGSEAGGGYVFGDVRVRPKDTDVDVGDTLQFNVSGGDEGSLVLLFVVGENNLWRVGLDFFDVDGKHRFTGAVPPALAGMTLDFLVCGYATNGMACESNLAEVSFH
jgi:hypothetical protein